MMSSRAFKNTETAQSFVVAFCLLLFFVVVDLFLFVFCLLLLFFPILNAL